MPINIVEADIWTVTVQAPADGDPVNSAIASLGHQDVTDRSYFLHRRLFGITGSRRHQVDLNTPAGLSANFQYVTANRWWQDAGQTVNLAWYYAKRPVTGRITGFGVVSQGVGHGGGTPAVPPSCDLYRINRLAGVDVLVGTAVDPNNPATIDTIHEWSVTGLTEDISSSRAYLLFLHGENGVGATNAHRYMQAWLAVDPAP